MMNQENNYKNKKGLALGPRRAVAYLALVLVSVLSVLVLHIVYQCNPFPRGADDGLYADTEYAFAGKLA